MNLFFFTLLTLAVYSTASLPLEKLLQNPKLFAAAFANADPDIIAKMIGLVDRLLAEGVDDAKNAVDDHSKRVAEQSTAQSAFNDASNTFDEVSKKLVEATTVQNNLITLEKDHSDQLAAAVTVLNAATTRKTNANGHMASTQKRVDSERAALLDVIDKLRSVKSDGRRRLLSDADPTAVENVVTAVENLIKAGEDELAAAIKASEEADQVHSEAVAAEAQARSTHETTVGELGTATSNVNTLTSSKAARLEEKNIAAKKLADANSALASALAWMNQEVARVKNEKATLEEVKALLQKNLD